MYNSQYFWPQLILRNWPLGRGVGRMMGMFRNLPIREGAVVTKEGFPIRIKSDLIGRFLYFTGAYEPKIVQVLCDFAEPGDILLDVGANIGYVSAIFLSSTARSCVIAVEPQPQLIELLSENLSQWPNRFRVVPAAISETEGQLPLYTIADNHGHASLIKDGWHEGAIMVDVWSGDRLFASIDRLDLMKIDVEGHEDVVIKTCSRHMERLKPKAILFEDHSRQAGPEGMIGAQLVALGYSVFGIRRPLSRWRRATLMPILARRDCIYSDYVAVSRNRRSPATARRRYGLG